MKNFPKRYKVSIVDKCHAQWENFSCGYFSLIIAFIATRLVLNAEKLLRDKNDKLQKAFDEIKVLRGILPICSFCKNIRNDQGYYEQIEGYIHKHSGVDFSHTICPLCMKKHYPEEYESIVLKKDQ